MLHPDKPLGVLSRPTYLPSHTQGPSQIVFIQSRPKQHQRLTNSNMPVLGLIFRSNVPATNRNALILAIVLLLCLFVTFYCWALHSGSTQSTIIAITSAWSKLKVQLNLNCKAGKKALLCIHNVIKIPQVKIHIASHDLQKSIFFKKCYAFF